MHIAALLPELNLSQLLVSCLPLLDKLINSGQCAWPQ